MTTTPGSAPGSGDLGGVAEPGMPALEVLVAEVIDTFDLDGRFAMQRVDRPTLIEIALIVVDPTRPTKAALPVLRERFGEDEISRSAFYNWTAELKARLSALRRRYRNRAAGLIDLDTDAEAGSLIEAKLSVLVMERLASADSLDDLDKRDLSTMLSLLESRRRQTRHRADLEADRRASETQLKLDTAEQQRDKLEAEVVLLRQRSAQLPERLKALQSQFEEVSKRVQRGEHVTADVLAAMRDELDRLAEEAKAQAAGRDAA